MNIVIPLAGEGKRFTDAGFPEKPFVDIGGKPLIQVVLESLPELWLDRGKFVFVTRKDYSKRLNTIAKDIGIKAKIVETVPTLGAACSVLEARSCIDTVAQKNPLLIINGDQIVNFSTFNFNTLANLLTRPDTGEVGGIILVFKAKDNKWSYVELNEYNEVLRVAEKDPISEWATCGIYMWTSTSAFFDCAENMIYNERRVNNEYYVAPVYNEVVKFGLKTGTVLALEVDNMIGLGTPEEVQKYAR